MTLQPVESSSINAIGYDAGRQVLHVEFKTGSTYHYHEVEQSDHEALMGAKSIGAHFSKHIRGNFRAVQA